MTDPNEMMPIIRQMHDADGDAARARILLNVPDLVLAKYARVFADACRRARFEAGEDFVIVRLAALRAVRDDMGNLPKESVTALMQARGAMISATGAG